jgi:cysteine desulfurase family protein (TIGR01976 family)
MSDMFDVEEVRSRFPALARDEKGRPVAYLDGPGGTQVPQAVIEAMSSTLSEGVSNLGGGFGASDEAVRITAEARQAVAELFNGEPSGVVFGQNMTSLTFAMSRAIANSWSEGDTVVLTSLDHDANFTPWQRVASERGVEVRVAELEPGTGLLPVDAVTGLLDHSVRLVAIPFASNALGTVVDVAAICAAAQEVGALTYVDAVHASPHRLIDVASFGCDYLAASSYKFFGPHTGMVYGRPEHLASLEAYKVRPAPSDPPGKWETGTQSFESLAGVTAAVGHIASFGEGGGRRSIETAMARMAVHERAVGKHFLDGIAPMGHVRLYGPPEMDEHRVATFALAVEGRHPDEVAARMAEHGVYVWSGHYYAVNAMDRLGLLDEGGLVRVGFVHYNTVDEADRALEVLDALAG